MEAAAMAVEVVVAVVAARAIDSATVVGASAAKDRA
jgi:hypothetical protein